MSETQGMYEVDRDYTVCWQMNDYFGRGTVRLDRRAGEREIERLMRAYPGISYWLEVAVPDRTPAPLMPDGPGPALVARIYHAYAVDDERSFQAVLADVPVAELRTLAQRLMRMSTLVRSVIETREM